MDRLFKEQDIVNILMDNNLDHIQTNDGIEVIQLIEQLQGVTVLTDGDTISRQAVLNLISEWCREEDIDIMMGFREDILQMPPSAVPNKTGYWVDIHKGNTSTVIAVRCSKCGESPKYAIRSRFCPNCGSPMSIIKQTELVHGSFNGYNPDDAG